MTPMAAVRRYLTLIKSLQTTLLLVTGLAGYLSGADLDRPDAGLVLGALAGSLGLAIAGSTLLNMVYDRDIDAQMKRTCARPLPAGQVNPKGVLALGVVTTWAGLIWALTLSPLYGAVVLAGVCLDVLVYTIWLKRRTPYAVIVGGLSGGMPVLAGRVLATGHLDLAGGLLALAVVAWIPTHILTYSLKYADDYRAAGVPTFPAAYGAAVTRALIAGASLAAAVSMLAAAAVVGLAQGPLHVLAGLGAGLAGLAAVSVWRPSPRVNFGLFKFASIYMLAAMLLLGAGA